MKIGKLIKTLSILKANDVKYFDYDIELCNFSCYDTDKKYFEVNEEDKEIYIYDIKEGE